ncbi:hypothetical protein [Paenibacillus sp. JNUCC31]|uniref:hypothetical protein n=1 Tax=Paenibacillus sp. JNUCC-31 TaxID=2777983 RepID=UPI001E35D7A3|nr:hypothetical protein [Paenibacillus sp. JNUCC-31]
MIRSIKVQGLVQRTVDLVQGSPIFPNSPVSSRIEKQLREYRHYSANEGLDVENDDIY